MMNRKEHIRTMLVDSPNDAFLRYALALEFAKENDIEAAINVTKVLLKEQPDYLGAYYQLGKWYEAIEDFKAAIEVYEKGIDLAEKQNNLKAKSELEQALWLID